MAELSLLSAKFLKQEPGSPGRINRHKRATGDPPTGSGRNNGCFALAVDAGLFGSTIFQLVRTLVHWEPGTHVAGPYAKGTRRSCEIAGI